MKWHVVTMSPSEPFLAVAAQHTRKRPLTIEGEALVRSCMFGFSSVQKKISCYLERFYLVKYDDQKVQNTKKGGTTFKTKNLTKSFFYGGFQERGDNAGGGGDLFKKN